MCIRDRYEGKDSLVKFKQGYMYYLYLNFNNKALANTNIRKALSLAIDRKDLCNKVLKDGSREADGFVSADFTYGPDGKEYRSEGKDYTEYNLKEAQAAFDQGLKELGVSSLKLRLLYGTDETPADTEAEYLQACFKKLKGLDIEMVATVKKDRVERQKSGDFDISCARWGPDFPDPITYLNLVSTGNSNNYGKYNNAKYDQLIAASTTERDAKKRWQMLYQAEDKQYFKYLLYTLGIVERWKRESNEAIKKLEELTGQIWENPYKPENERFTLKLTDEERTTITNRIKEGYYRPEAVQARKDEEKRKAYEKKRAEIINDCKKKQQKAENEKRVMLAVLDAGLSVCNVIYYDHSNELVFNWKDYETKVTENDFNKFVSSVNRSLLPAGITFKMK